MKAPATISSTQAEDDTRRWLERAVIGLNLCPFAKAVHAKRQIHYAVYVAREDDHVIDALLEQGELGNYYLAHSARADLYRRLGRTAEARSSYEKALALTQQEPERQFLQERIRQLK